MHIHIEESRCCSTGQCVMAAPEVFDQREDDGIAFVADPSPPEGQWQAVMIAVGVCPARAITVS